jgi:hypothetical protein
MACEKSDSRSDSVGVCCQIYAVRIQTNPSETSRAMESVSRLFVVTVCDIVFFSIDNGHYVYFTFALTKRIKIVLMEKLSDESI